MCPGESLGLRPEEPGTDIRQHLCSQKYTPEQQMPQSTEGQHQTEHGTRELGFSISVFIYLKKNQQQHILVASQESGNE